MCRNYTMETPILNNLDPESKKRHDEYQGYLRGTTPQL